ncbi:hypothetical protein RRG08_008222 [Elysia crispata]|uniref:Uncharacterized protein n=1 Tax=Elysia crispata TaxID=231223 RepID=A0AAE0YBH4_9GAST|nr:hypothetical protein RRG08_008222 [Elysia crispata]
MTGQCSRGPGLDPAKSAPRTFHCCVGQGEGVFLNMAQPLVDCFSKEEQEKEEEEKKSSENCHNNSTRQIKRRNRGGLPSLAVRAVSGLSPTFVQVSTSTRQSVCRVRSQRSQHGQARVTPVTSSGLFRYTNGFSKHGAEDSIKSLEQPQRLEVASKTE